MTRKKIHMIDLYSWVAANHNILKRNYRLLPKHEKETLPFTLFTIVAYCQYAKI